MRIHLGHHFYGAGNLGDDFMLAGFLRALESLAPEVTLTCCVPFPLPPLRRRFPAITWLPYELATRRDAIAKADVWLGLGGSPFQHALSRWFVDHLLEEAANCARENKPMFYLGIGLQTIGELASPDVHRLVDQAAGVWTRDAASAGRLAARGARGVHSAADPAHVFFAEQPPPPARGGRFCIVANFDYGTWPGQSAAFAAIDRVSPVERIWLAQENRDLPGAERVLHAALPANERSRWRLIVPDLPVTEAGKPFVPKTVETLGAFRYDVRSTAQADEAYGLPGDPLKDVLTRWPSGEWLLTSRYHAALAGAWAGSKVIVIGTNEKLRAAAAEIGAPILAADADLATAERIIATAPVARLQSIEQKASAVAKAVADKTKGTKASRASPTPLSSFPLLSSIKSPGFDPADRAFAACRDFLVAAAAGAPHLHVRTEPS